MTPLRLVLADDHPVVLRGLQALLALEPDVDVVAVCTDGDEAVEAVEAHDPDVLVMDASMPRSDGLATLRRLRDDGHRVPVVILAASLDDGALEGLLRASVEAIVLKEAAASDLVAAIRAAARGERWIARGLTHRVLALMGSRPDDGGDDLTPREREISEHVARGMSNRHVARELDIAESTVKMHLHSVFTKLDIANRVELSLLARKRGWI